jgi:hypothetical protein
MTTTLKDGSLKIRHYSYKYPNRPNPDWVYINLVVEGVSDDGKDYLERLSSDYEKRRAIHDIAKYEKALEGMDMVFPDDPDENGYYRLEFEYAHGDPNDQTSLVQVQKDARVYQLDAFPGIYRYQEYCLNNLVVQGALQQMKLLKDFGTSKDTHFVEMSTFQTTLETFFNNWH